jgi:probable HAF family extracellular repeat protein
MKRLAAVRALAAGLGVGAAHGSSGKASGTSVLSFYRVTNLSSLGGTLSAGSSINDRSWIAGFSNFAGDQTQHAALWRNGSLTDLGTLGGQNSSVLWPVKNVTGLVSGIAETSEMDPLGEAWSCSAFFPTITGHTCLGFVWQAGSMRPLPTLGGNNGFATGSNDQGQVVGWAENTVHDPTCVGRHQVLQFRAVVWGPGQGQLRELPPLAGDTVTAATAINDRGQVVGISGICDRAVGRFSAIHAVLWERGSVADIGNLGGVAWNTPMAINQTGDVVGFSNVSAAAGGAFDAQAFLWTRRGGIRPLGTLPGDVYSQALGINVRRQVVGTSCSAGFASCRAFLWQDGVMTDLNALVAPGYSDYLYSANDINDFGAITGQAVEQGSGAYVSFVASPSGVANPAKSAGSTTHEISLPRPLRAALLRRLGLHTSDLGR